MILKSYVTVDLMARMSCSAKIILSMVILPMCSRCSSCLDLGLGGYGCVCECTYLFDGGLEFVDLDAQGCGCDLGCNCTFFSFPGCFDLRCQCCFLSQVNCLPVCNLGVEFSVKVIDAGLQLAICFAEYL